MSPELWSIIGTGIVILVAIAASNRSLRRETSERVEAVQRELGGLRQELGGVRQELSQRIDAVRRELGERMDALSEQLGDVRERLGRVEGLLEGLGWTARKRKSKGRGDERQGPALP